MTDTPFSAYNRLAGFSRPGVHPPDSREKHTMKTNEGSVDRAVRIIVGLVLISLVFIGPKSPWGWIGVLPLATGLLGFCGVYAVLGINTCKSKSAK